MGIVEKLLNANGVDVNIKDDKGMTPLSIAIDRGNSFLVRRLMKAGAKVSLADFTEAQKKLDSARFNELPKRKINSMYELDIPEETATEIYTEILRLLEAPVVPELWT